MRKWVSFGLKRQGSNRLNSAAADVNIDVASVGRFLDLFQCEMKTCIGAKQNVLRPGFVELVPM